MRSRGNGEIAQCDIGRATGQDGTDGVVRLACEEFLEGLVVIAFELKMVQETSDRAGNFVGGATIADGTRNGSDGTNAAADAEVVGVHHFAVDLYFLAFDADVRDPVLAARVGAAGDVETKLILIVGEALFELFGHPAREGFGFGESEFAKFRTGAGNGATSEGGSLNRKAGGGEFVDDGFHVGFGNVDEEKVLHRGEANVAVAVAFGEIGSKSKLLRIGAAAKNGSADGEKAGLMLRDDAEVIAMNARRKVDGLGRIEFVAETGFDGGEKSVGGPTVLEEEILHARFVAGDAKHLRFAEDFGDGANHGNGLVPRNEGVQGDGEMGLGGESTGNANGEADFGSGVTV